MSQKLVSVITPCFNGEKYIEKLLDSLLSQTYPRVEMFVIDDGSTDKSAAVIKSYVQKFEKKGYTLKYAYQKNQGQSAAINNALKLVTGDYLVWPDADDYYASPDSISKMVATLDSTDGDVSMVRVQYNVVDVDGNIIDRYNLKGENRYKVDLFESCLFEFGTTFWGAAGGYMAKVSHIDKLIPNRSIYFEEATGQNWQICLPLLYGHKCLTIEEFLYSIVSHDDSHSRNMATNIRRQKAYFRTIKRTLEGMSIPADYRRYLLSRASLMTSTNLNESGARRRALLRRFIKGVVPHAVIVILRKKSILKQPLSEVAQRTPEKSLLEDLSDYDNQIFEQGFAHGDFSQANIEGWMLFCAHVLEKAMSRVNFEEGHNFFRLEQITRLLREYDDKGFDRQNFAYEYALSSVKEYILLHEENGFSTKKIKEVLGDRYEQAVRTEKELAGYKVLSKDEKSFNKSKNFAELQSSRYSVREFSNEKVDIRDIRQSIELSMKAPSVCNRQPARVYNLMDEKKVKSILEIQGGFHGYDMPPALLLVTTDVRNYVGENERNQGFIDGGSFAMSLLLSLEYFGLAACPLHVMFTPEVDKKVKDILDIKTPEYLVMLIAVGHFDKNSKAAVSSRYSAGEITKEYV